VRPATRPLKCRSCPPEAYKLDNGPDVRVAVRAGEQWGVLSLEELLECGMSRNAVSVRVRNGRLHPVYRGVYAVGHANLSLEGRFLAAVKACGPGAALSHFAAAALFGLVRWDDRYPEVLVIGTTTRVHPRLRVHRTGVLDAADLIRYERIAVTSPARTLVDLAGIVETSACGGPFAKRNRSGLWSSVSS
jgi:predicted transcriptional regulator of viral defense system